MNAFLYLKELIQAPSGMAIIMTSQDHEGDLSFYWPEFDGAPRLRQDPNIQKYVYVNGFWNITFTPLFWQHQLKRYVQSGAVPSYKISVFGQHLINNLYDQLLIEYQRIFQTPYTGDFDPTDGLTEPADLAIIKQVIMWEFRGEIPKKPTVYHDDLHEYFFKWWRAHKIKGSILRILDPKNKKATDFRMLIPTVFKTFY